MRGVRRGPSINHYLWNTGSPDHRRAEATPSSGRLCRAMTVTDVDARSESAPIWRYSVIAMQLGFLRTIAPIEIVVGAERRRAAQFFIVDVEFVGLEFRIVF